jgi:hypothetical protein
MSKEPRVAVVHNFGRIRFIQIMPLSDGLIVAAIAFFFIIAVNLAILALNLIIFLIVTLFTGSKRGKIASGITLAFIVFVVVMILIASSRPSTTAGNQYSASDTQQAATSVDTSSAASTPAVTPASQVTDLGDLPVLPQYCQSIGYADASPQPDGSANWWCVSGNNTNVDLDMNKACVWQYHNDQAYAGSKSSASDMPSSPYDWECYAP